MAESNKETQFRFLMAATLSIAVLFAWTYFFPGAKPDPAADANVAQVNTESNTAPANTQPTADQVEKPAQLETPSQTEKPDETVQKQVIVKTPLYEVTLDSKGAAAISWLLLKNDSPDKKGKSLFASGSGEGVKKPLQLISPEGLKREPRLAPFLLSTDDPNLTALVNRRNYAVSGDQDVYELTGDQTQQIDFTLTDEATGVEVKKTFIFRADSYLSDLQIKLTKGGQPVANTKLVIGSSIGDQNVNHYNFYQIEPEGVAIVNGKNDRQYGATVIGKVDEGQVAVPGNVDWAGVGDTYFAMAAIPAQPLPGLEYKASKYEVEINPVYTGFFSWIMRNPESKQVRHLITAYVPISTDGSANKIYTGTKDSFVLGEYSEKLNQETGRVIDLEAFINYGWLGFFVRPLSHPILVALNFLYGYTHNYGIAIIIFTFFFYNLLFPLRWYQSKSFKKSASNAPKMKEMQEKLKDMQKKGIPNDDPKMRELQMQQLKMTKDALPIGGCLPMVLQFPFLIALYYTVSIALGFRQASFLWLPDLSAGDPFHILEFGFAFSMILSMKFSPQAATVTPEQQMQQKMMTYFMPVMMLWIMWSAPAGLLLYWFFGNIVSFVQQLIINHYNKPNVPPAGEALPVVLNKKGKPKFSK